MIPWQQFVIERQLPQHPPQLPHRLEGHPTAGWISGRQKYLELLLKPFQRPADVRGRLPSPVQHLRRKGAQRIVLSVYDAVLRRKVHPKIVYGIMIHIVHSLPRPSLYPIDSSVFYLTFSRMLKSVLQCLAMGFRPAILRLYPISISWLDQVYNPCSLPARGPLSEGGDPRSNSRSKRKTAKLLQQSGGAPRFGKHSSHLCSV